MQKARHKEPHTVRFNVYKTSRIGQSKEIENRLHTVALVLAGGGGCGGENGK